VIHALGDGYEVYFVSDASGGVTREAHEMAIQRMIQAGAYSKLFYWNEVPKGGHFAALEQPDLFVSELRKCFAQVP